ncbi:hypothetical protein [Sulfitobacter delicatus]|uniref:Uncharacterized protein n=1 Tax=Sulfitobacter delicatus TaxID=218672 RepID=A0A1G7P7C3_9RHOB|nr:hypothetical protein [Sulfitobacter delicatus]SDF82168.1 hypothetical protein SAMN04489759_103246 [Sulfitobacter delicatus]
MRITKALVSSFLAMTLAAPVLANPNEAPDFTVELARQLGMPTSAVNKVEKMGEDLTREGLTAHYFTAFEAEVSSMREMFAKVDGGDGYVVVQKVLDTGDRIPVIGNVLGAYEENGWEVRVNIEDVQMPGGRPMNSFRSGNTIVMQAGTDKLEAFLKQRDEALETAQELKLAEMERKAEQDALARDLERKQKEAKAKAAAKAEEERRLYEKKVEATRIAERDKADAMLMSLFSMDKAPELELTYGGIRAPATVEMVRADESMVEMKATFELGMGKTYTTDVKFNLSHEENTLRMGIPQVKNWRGGSNLCTIISEPNTEGGFILFSDTANFGSCGLELLVKGLDISKSEG